MTVPKITAAQYQDQLRTGIASRDATVDTGFGPVVDIVIAPVSQVLEQQNDRLRQVSALLSLQNLDLFSSADLDAFVFNEGLVRSPGSQATGTVTFSRSTAPTSDATVQRGFPIATLPDESTGKSVTFVTSQTLTMPAATASSYFNPTTGRYELVVPVICLVQGSTGIVGPNRLTRPLRPLVNFDSVTNPSAVSQGGAIAETNTLLAQRYQISVEGRQLGTPTGIKKYVLDTYPGIQGINTVFGNNPLLTRAATDAGAVDAFVIATQVTNVANEQHTFLGIGQTVPLLFPPIVSVSSVQFGANTLVVGTDYNVVLDSTGYSGSTRGVDGIVILPSTTQTLIAGSSVLSITYTYNTLVRQLQADSTSENVFVFGRDLLYRQGAQIAIVLTATVTVVSGFNPTTVAGLVSTAISNYINGLSLGSLVEAFEVQAAAATISGVQNFTITRLTRSTVASGTSDIQMAGNEYPRISNSNLVLTTM